MESDRVKYVIAVVVLGVMLTLVSWQSMSAGIPRPWAPFPLISYLLLFGAPVFVTIIFWVWNLQLFKGIGHIPIRSIALYLSFAALSIWHNLVGIPYGVKYQGREYTMIVTIVNFMMIVSIAILLIIGYRRKTFLSSLLFHWLLFAWFASYSFPYLGELI